MNNTKIFNQTTNKEEEKIKSLSEINLPKNEKTAKGEFSYFGVRKNWVIGENKNSILIKIVLKDNKDLNLGFWISKKLVKVSDYSLWMSLSIPKDFVFNVFQLKGFNSSDWKTPYFQLDLTKDIDKLENLARN